MQLFNILRHCADCILAFTAPKTKETVKGRRSKFNEDVPDKKTFEGFTEF